MRSHPDMTWNNERRRDSVRRSGTTKGLGTRKEFPLEVKFLRDPLLFLPPSIKMLNSKSDLAKSGETKQFRDERQEKPSKSGRRKKKPPRVSNSEYFTKFIQCTLRSTRKTQQNPRIPLTSAAKRSEMRLDCVRNASYCRRRLLTIHYCVVKMSDAWNNEDSKAPQMGASFWQQTSERDY